MSLSGHWWESSTLLTQISTVAAVTAVLVAVWAAAYATKPRRGLAYSANIRRPRRGEENAWVNHVVKHSERDRAVILTFVLRGNGRLDVSSSLFDNETQITVSAKNAEIRSAAPVTTRGGGGLAPPMQVRDNKLEIKPGLIGRKQVLTYTLVAVTRKIPWQWQLQAGAPYLGSVSVRVTVTRALVDTSFPTVERGLIGLGVFVALAGGFFALWDVWLRHTSFDRHLSSLLIFVTLALITSVRLIQYGIARQGSRRQIKASVRKAIEQTLDNSERYPDEAD
jgi:hypothetical protein